ncbi:MAG TPA: glycosyltransferase family 39 protein, partial [Sumerlaeia bacterium]|nr:glycosyltransferase family 39 protein [Sumerlaeia bacterium]
VCAGESPPQRLALGFLSLGLVWAAPCILQSLLPNHDWDSALYHLPLGRRFIERGIGAAATDPAFVAYDFPAAIHLFYSMFQALGAESGVIPFNLLSVGGVGLGTGVLAARLGGPRAGWWAAGICLSCNMFWELGCDARIDSILTFYFLLACHAVFAWLQNERQSDAWLPAAGMMLGLVVGAKYTGILFAVILGAPALVRLFLIHAPARRRALAALGLGVACLLAPSGWWYARNAVVLGDPFYQFGGGLKYYDAQGELRAFGPAWEEMTRRRPLSDEVLAAAKEFERLAVDRGPNPSLFNVLDVFLHPSRYEVKPYHWLSPLFLLFLFLPLFRRDWIAFWLLALPIAGYCGVALAIYFSRYAMPVFPLLAVGAALVLDSVRRRGWAWFWGLLLCALLTFNSAAQWRKSALLYPWERLTGRVSEIEWLEQVGYNGSPMAPPMIRFINEAVERGEIERNARIFMLGEGKGHLLRCSYLPDSTRECYRWLTELMNADCDHARVLESLRKQGVTHLLVDHGYFLWSLRSVPVNVEQLAFALRHFSRFTAEHAQVVHVGEMTTLFRVRLPKEDAEVSEDPTALGADQAPPPDPEGSRRPAARRRGGF